MDALLPSEIARLVFGYLQEQKCEEAAKIFMETSPHLEECRVVSQRGGRYSTKVGGLSLTDILDKYCSVNVMVQEKISKVSDNEQMKHCNDLLEQLRYLLEGSSRSHRFVVNISVPQNSQAGAFGSPIVSGSSRKRNHSHSEKGKRASKSLNNLIEKSQKQHATSQNCEVEATPLESLPGYKSLGHIPPSQNYVENNSNVNEKFSNKTNFISSTNEQMYNAFATSIANHPYSTEPNLMFPNNINSNCKDQSTETVEKNIIEPIKDKCTAGTSTEELMTYTSAEVQTGPCDLLDPESDVNHDESIQNLGILTKELLNRTEIHERIAENINKAILPVETSFREDNTCQNPVEANTSLLTDLDNAIKSVVQATETDPVFEGFLHEIFSVAETDTSPDEDSDGRQTQGLNKQPSANTIEPMEVGENFGANEALQPKIDNEPKGPEVPLKQRLRNSAKPQQINNEDEEKESDILLESANAEAVMNIVNVIARKNSMLSNEQMSEVNSMEDPATSVRTAESICSAVTEKSGEEVKPKFTKKNIRKSKPKQKPMVPRPEPKPEPEVATMPTLILCSERDVGLFPDTVSKTSSHGYVPIVPKPGDPVPSTSEPPATIYLRTVNVPRHLVNQSTIEATQKVNPLLQKAFQMQQQSPQKQPVPNDDPIVIPLVVADNRLPVTSSPIVRPSTTSTTAPTSIGESITLYAGETESTEMKMSPINSLPVINVDESIMGMATGTGLSPFFKMNFANPVTEEAKEAPKPEELPQPAAAPAVTENPELDAEAKSKADPPELIPIESNVAETVEIRQGVNDELNKSKTVDGIITRRTPKTLMKARAKNNRLSLSTPRRRNSHVRALDFNTPVKTTSTVRKQPQSCMRAKAVCRAGLFKSPPFESEVATAAAAAMNVHSVLDVQTVKKVRTVSPIKPTYLRVPIATRSPAPKLQGNWAKVTGIGLILEGESTSESSPEKIQPEEKTSTTTTTTTTTVTTTVVEKKSWDSDLRKIIGATVSEEEQEKSSPKSAKKSTTKKRSIGEKTKASETTEKPKEKEKSNEKEKPKDKKKPAKESDAGEKEPIDEANTSVEANIVPSEKNEITPPGPTTISKRLASVKQSTESDETQAKPTSATKVSPAMRMPNLMDLETPRKEELASYIPPTPRIINTPGDSLIRSTRNKNRNISIKDCVVDTPDFPVTPSIVHTPKIVDGEDHESNASPYYEPDEHHQSQKQKEVVNAVVNSEKIVVQETTTTVTIQRSVVELQESKKVEITQVEIDEKPQDSSAETDEKDAEAGVTSEDTSKETVEEEETVEEPTAANSDSDSDGDESDSSSSSSSSSDSSSSSSSSYSSAASSPEKSVREDQGNHSSAASSPEKSVREDQGNHSNAESEDESPEVAIEARPEAAAANESSPRKVFSVVEEGEVQETPAKEDNGIVEAEISETPSVSNADRAQRRDSLTNLTSKISAIITTSQSDQARKQAAAESTVSSSEKQEKNQTAAGVKPKIIKVENIAPTDGIAVQVSKLLQGDLHKVTTIQQQQQQAMVNAKLGLTLEEKRLRVMAKFKEGSSNKSTNVHKKGGDDGKQKKASGTRKGVEGEKVVSSTTDTSKCKTTPTAMDVTTTQCEKVKKVVAEEISKVEKKTADDEKKNEKETKETKKTKGKASPKKKVAQEKEQEQDGKIEASEVKKLEEAVISVPLTVENSKGILKAKVDQVKRDLFSDEEMNDQRTTRSQAARLSTDTQKSDESQESNAVQGSSHEKIPGVLECLQLIPANKGEKEHDLNNKSISEEGYSNMQTNCLDKSYVYDESVPFKKRKRKYSSSTLETEYHFYMDDELFPHMEILKVIPFKELFKLSPKIKKKIQSPKKSPSKVKKSKISNKSSPTKSSRCKKTRSAEKKKSCKRKNTSPSKEDKPDEKKPKTDPQTLFNRISIDDFLKSVHVPE